MLNPDRAWGQPFVVDHLRRAITAYHAHFGAEVAPVLVGDLSQPGGGKLSPHLSHRSGRDVDIGVIRVGRRFDRPVATSPRALDVERTWWLIAALIQTGEVQYVFLDRRLIRPLHRHALEQGVLPARMLELFHFPRRSRWGVGMIRQERGHQAHFHVRFRRQSQQELVPTA